MKNAIKYKRRISSVFLYAYLAFIITNAIHFHAYSLFDNPGINNYSKSNSLNNHFLSSSYSFCTISHYSNSILDLKFSSNVTSPYQNEGEELIPVLSDRFIPNNLITKNSNRAPPFFS
jgi:hypothetical protein